MNNICVECTLLGKKGKVVIDYNHSTMGYVNGYDGKSVNNLIVDNMEREIMFIG